MFRRSQLWFYGLLAAGSLFLVGTFLLPLGDWITNLRNDVETFCVEMDICRPSRQVTKEMSEAGRLALGGWKQAEYYDLCELATRISDGRALDGLTKEQVIEALGKPLEGPFKCSRTGHQAHEHQRKGDVVYDLKDGSWTWSYFVIEFKDGRVVSTAIEKTG